MSQKKAKLIRKYANALGLTNTGTAMKIPTKNNPNRVVVFNNERTLKNAFKEANRFGKTEATLEAKDVIRLSAEKKAETDKK